MQVESQAGASSPTEQEGHGAFPSFGDSSACSGRA